MIKKGLNKSIPFGFDYDVRTVVCSSNATAIINLNGELKFWFNHPSENFLSENVFEKTFPNTQTKKVSLSNRFLCAINDAKELNC